jgi:hypothetical protein
MTLEQSDLNTIKDHALKKFEERVLQANESREGIEREVVRIESQLEQLYSFTAMMARREGEVSRTAELWDNLVRTCDIFAARIFELAQQYSLNSSSYDTILDIRSAAEELRDLHRP